jgi:diacylglycerol kinase family enzyme
MPLGVIPTGTFNHFAKDAGIPADPAEAAAVIAAGRTVRFDIAQVNGRTFINNSSLGLYPTIVSERERISAKGVPKHAALPLAAVSALRRFPNLTVRVRAGSEGAVLRTPFFFVGNNVYEFAGLDAGRRTSLRDGCLHISIVEEPRRLAVVKLALLALFGRVEAAREFTSLRVQSVQVETMRHRIPVALDGEVVMMRSPLRYSVRPGALLVLTTGG